MNGDELLKAFLDFILKEHPKRFYHSMDRPTCYHQYSWRAGDRVYLGAGSFKMDCEACTLRNDKVKIEYITEGCYGSYDAVLFISNDGVIKESIPIEAKGNTDTLDERLRGQIFIAIKNFGKSLLLLDSEQAYKVKKHNIQKMLPCEIWFYNGTTFEAMTDSLVRFHSRGTIEVSARALEHATGIHDYSQLRQLRLKFRGIRYLLDALAYNQWNWKGERKFTPQEAQLFYELIGVPISKGRRQSVEQTVKATAPLAIEKKPALQKSLFEQQLAAEASV